MNLDILKIIILIFLLIAFICLCVWVYIPRNREKFENYGRLPFVGEDNSE